jgi:hypothetical protein
MQTVRQLVGVFKNRDFCGGAPTAGLGIAAALLALLLLGPASDRISLAHGVGTNIDLPPLMLWAWDRDDDLRMIDPGDTGVAFLAATLTLRGEGVTVVARHNPLALPAGVRRAAVVHVDSDRTEPPTLSTRQLQRFVDTLATVAAEVPHRVLQVDYEAPASQRAFFLGAMASLRERMPQDALSVTALASWCLNEDWTGDLAADEVVPMLFRMGHDGRRALARLAAGGDFRVPACRGSLGVATDELPGTLPSGRRVYAFNPRRWSEETYRMLRMRIRQWSSDRSD